MGGRKGGKCERERRAGGRMHGVEVG